MREPHWKFRNYLEHSADMCMWLSEPWEAWSSTGKELRQAQGKPSTMDRSVQNPLKSLGLSPALKHQFLLITSSWNTPNKWGVEFVYHRRCCLNTEKQPTGQKCNMQEVPKHRWNFSLFRNSLILACRAFIWSVTALYLQTLLYSSAINTWIFCFIRPE